MNKKVLNERLKTADLSKKELAAIVGLSVGSVNNWGGAQNVPHWVETWLNLYIENKSYKDFKDMLKKSGLCEDY